MPKGKANKKYTGEYKQMVVEAVRSEGLSYEEAEKHFGISAHGRIQIWERVYMEEGPEGLYLERRGRSSKGRPTKLQPQVEADLIAENQRLRAENAYLKNLQALVLKDERKARKKRW